jgi:hypothetical protein
MPFDAKRASTGGSRASDTIPFRAKDINICLASEVVNAADWTHLGGAEATHCAGTRRFSGWLARSLKLSVMEGIEDLPLHGGRFSDRLGFYR